MLIKILSFVSCSTRTFNTHVTKDKTDSSSDVTLTLKRKPSSVSATNFEDSPVVGNLKPNKQEKKSTVLYLTNSQTGRRRTNKIWSPAHLLSLYDKPYKRIGPTVRF